jgi:putative hydrolase of HD superfamily
MSTVPPQELEGIVGFLRAAEALKDVTRTAWTSAGARETVAAHSWRLCLMALVLGRRVPGVDLARLLAICIVHDLGEAIGGDVSAVLQAGAPPKAAQERADLLRLCDPLPGALRDELVALWDEYEAASTPEARLAKGLDKLETILQHVQGENPPGFDYRFNLAYGRAHTEREPLLAALRAMLDEETERRARAAEGAT